MLLDSGDLQELFPSLVGEWDLDKKQFIEEQEALESMAKNTYYEQDYD